MKSVHVTKTLCHECNTPLSIMPSPGIISGTLHTRLFCTKCTTNPVKLVLISPNTETNQRFNAIEKAYAALYNKIYAHASIPVCNCLKPVTIRYKRKTSTMNNIMEHIISITCPHCTSGYEIELFIPETFPGKEHAQEAIIAAYYQLTLFS